MFNPNTILLVCISFLICTPFVYGTDVDLENDDEKYKKFDNYLQSFGVDGESEQYHPKEDVPELTEEQLDVKRRRMLAAKYLDELESVKQDWIDPYDMGRISMRKISDEMENKIAAPEITSAPPIVNKKDDSPSINVKKEELCSSTSISTSPKEQCALDTVYITRWLKKLLNRIEKESGKEFSIISFPLDTDALDSLKQMASEKTFEVSTLDEVFSNLLAQADIRQKESYLKVAYANHTDILRGIACVSGITLFLYALRRSFLRCPKLTILCCCIVINIGWHWMHLYQKIKAHKHAELSSMQIPSQCKKHDLGLLEHMTEYFKSFFATSECGKYYEALLVDPVWEVSLSVAATEAVTATLFQPLFASSRALNYFLKQLFEGLPIYLVVFLIVFIFFVTLMKFGYAIKLPLLFRIEPCRPVGGSRVEELESRTQLPTLTDTILNAVTDKKTTSVKRIRKQDSTVGVKESRSQSIDYSSDEDGTGKGIYKQETQTSSFRGTNSEGFSPQVDESMISEEGLAVRSGYFEVLSEGEGLKSIQYPFSNSKVNVGSTVMEDVTVSVTTSEKLAAYLEAVAKCDVTTNFDAKNLLVSDSIQTGPVNPGCLDVNDAMKGLGMTESFEIIPRDDISTVSMCSSCSAGLNSDTNPDELDLLHRNCQFCNSANSIA